MRSSSFKNKAVSILLPLLVVGITSESLSYLLFPWVTGQSYHRKQTHTPENPISLGSDAKSSVPWEVSLHPYVGFGNPPGLQDPIPRSSVETKVVALTGGSMAHQLYVRQHEAMKTRLEASKWSEGKKVSVILLGQGAWKQPQQLMSVNYYLVQGGKIDLLINLDGHNELQDIQSNYRKHVHWTYPQFWRSLSTHRLSPKEASLIGRISYLRSLQSELGRTPPFLFYSTTFSLFWKSVQNFLQNKVASNITKLNDVQITLGNEKLGQSNPKLTLKERLIRAAELWKTSSLLLYELSRGSGFSYLHFLQPNQYVPHSKTFSAEERRRAFRPPKTAITLGYPLLQTAGRDLVSKGVNFHDLTGVFRNVPQTIYADTCCHVNPEGSQRIMNSIIEAVLKGKLNDKVI